MSEELVSDLLPEVLEAELVDLAASEAWPSFDAEDPEPLDEEVDLDSLEGADRDIVGVYFNEAGKYRLFTPEEERTVFAEYRDAKDPQVKLEIREKIAQHNLRLVISIAKKHARRSNLDLLDLIQEGNIGLLRAIDLYKLEKGFKFSTYATWWIRQKMMRSNQDTGKTIRLPVHIYTDLSRLWRAQRKLSEEYGPSPSDEDLAAEMSVPLRKVKQLLAIRTAEPTSLNIPLSNGKEETDTTLGEYLTDPNSESSTIRTEARLEYRLALKQVERIRTKVKERFASHPRNAQACLRRWGFQEGNPGYEVETLETIGKSVGLTRERVRQLEVAATKVVWCICEDVEVLRSKLLLLKEVLEEAPKATHLVVDMPEPKAPLSPRKSCPRPEPVPPPLNNELQSLATSLEGFAKIDARIFSLYYGLGGDTKFGITFTATKLGLKEANIKRSLDRVWAALPSLGCSLDEGRLLTILGRQE